MKAITDFFYNKWINISMLLRLYWQIRRYLIKLYFKNYKKTGKHTKSIIWDKIPLYKINKYVKNKTGTSLKKKTKRTKLLVVQYFYIPTLFFYSHHCFLSTIVPRNVHFYTLSIITHSPGFQLVQHCNFQLLTLLEQLSPSHFKEKEDTGVTRCKVWAIREGVIKSSYQNSWIFCSEQCGCVLL